MTKIKCYQIVYYRILKEKLFKKQNTHSNMKYYAKIKKNCDNQFYNILLNNIIINIL